MKKLFFILIFLWFLFTTKAASFAAEPVNLYFFFSLGCPHCAKETQFLNREVAPRQDVVIHAYEVSQNPNNAALFAQMGQSLGIQVSGVPVTIVGNWHTVGYENDQTTGQEILRAIQTVQQSPNPTPAPQLPSATSAPPPEIKPTLPQLAGINLEALSLPLLTIVIAAVDGFNPCAMWVLLFLISMLLGMKNRLKMWILGSVFILTSGIVYYFFLAAWLNVFLFIGFIQWIRLLISSVAISAGLFQLRSFFKDKSGGCTAVTDTKRQKIFAQIKSITSGKYFLISIVGMMVLAVSVNMIELVCSAGLPAVYTQVLSYNQLPHWQYYVYLGLYTLIFMLDDLAVFAIAMFSLQAVGIQNKYARYSKLIGGSIILIIGFLMLVKPEWLMFG
jgi:hypothetical protein